MLPTRKAVLCVMDPDTGRIYTVKATLSRGVSLIPVSLESDTVGVAKESTLAAVKAQIDKFRFDENNYLYIHNPPNLDAPISTVRDNMNIGRIGGVPQTGEDWTPHIRRIDSLATEATLSTMNLYLNVEGGFRCHDVTVDDVFAVPSGVTWYVKSISITTGKLYLEGNLEVVG